MFKTPELPTDNLYKFIAIFGLVIFLFGSYQIFKEQTSFYTSIKDENIEHSKGLFEKSKQDSKSIINEEKIKYKRQKIKVLYGINNTSLLDEKSYLNIKNKDNFEKDLFELKSLEYEQLLILDNEFYWDRENKASYTRRNIPVLVPYFLLSFIGVLLMFVGFRLWYLKTQKFVDIELSKSVVKE